VIRPCRQLAALATGLVLVSALAVAAGAAGAAAQPARPKVLILGDSVVEMICKYVPAELDELRQTFDPTCDGLDVAPFRRTSDGPGLIRSHAADIGDHLVLALGYNDGPALSQFRERARAILEMPEVKALHHVFWLTFRDVKGT
jgi:hypothetical protein